MKLLILAGGKGTRLQSDKFNLPKALKELNGKPLIEYVLENTSFIEKKDVYIVVGYKGEMIKEALGPEYNYINQDKQLGTGHAVMVAEPYLKDCNDDIMILYGDMPMISRDTFEGFAEYHKSRKSMCTVLTSIFEEQPPYGRIIRDENDNFLRVIEEKDCTEEQKKIKELNCGPDIIHSSVLFDALKKVRNTNSQGEYYLTDVPEIIRNSGDVVNIFICKNCCEMLGINTLEDLKQGENILND